MSTVTSTGRVVRSDLGDQPADQLRGVERVREFYSRFRIKNGVVTATILTVAAFLTRAHLSGEVYS